jgi:predicted phosphodiesterase
MDRWRRLGNGGLVQISTDLHGNGADHRRLREHFLDLRRREESACWVILGDAVHAPSESARKRNPELYDFDDESLFIVEDILDLMESFPEQVFYVLGNHDFGHVGGPPTRKFHTDEVDHLEAVIGPEGTQQLRRLFAPALLAVVAPCGVLLAHGSPDDSLRSLDDLDGIDLPPAGIDPYRAHLLDSFLTSYGQQADVTARLLARLSTDTLPLHLVIHGHDRDESGYFTEGGNQVCPVIFGAANENKRFLVLDLASSYRTVADLREGREILRLYG